MTVPPPTFTPTSTSIPSDATAGMAPSTSTAGLLASTEYRIRADIAEVSKGIEKTASRLWGTYGLSAIALVISAFALFRSCK